MAIGIHVARIGVFNVDATGVVRKKDDPSVTIRQQLETSIDHRVIEDSLIPNSSGNPTVKAYLEAEADDDFVLQHIDQNSIITYHRSSDGGFSS